MPEPGTVQQEKKENQKQQVPGKSEPVFRQKIHDKCFLESVAAQFHISGVMNTGTKIENNENYSYNIIPTLDFIIPIFPYSDFV